MQQIYTNTTKIYVDQKGGNNLLYLPLADLMKLSSSGQQPMPVEVPRTAAPEVTSPSTVPAEPVTARRDSLRSRDREGGR